MNAAKTVTLIIVLLLNLVLANGCCTPPLDKLFPWCEEEDPEIPEPFTASPNPITRLCPDHVGGDDDFKGHGPRVKATVTLELRNAKREIWAIIDLHAKETRSDWTEARGRWVELLWTAPGGRKIHRIDSAMSSGCRYVDDDHDLDRPGVTGGNLVQRFEVMGDSGGRDVGHCTTDDVFISVWFNPIRGTTMSAN